MRIRGIIIWIALFAVGFQASSMAAEVIVGDPKANEVPEISSVPTVTVTPSPGPTITIFPTPTPTFIPTPIFPPPLIEEFTPSSTPSPTITPTPSPTPFVCLKLQGKQIGKHLGWALQGRLCIGKRG